MGHLRRAEHGVTEAGPIARGEREEQGGGGALDDSAAQWNFPQGGREAGSAQPASGKLGRGGSVASGSAVMDGWNQGNGLLARALGQVAEFEQRVNGSVNGFVLSSRFFAEVQSARASVAF